MFRLGVKGKEPGPPLKNIVYIINDPTYDAYSFTRGDACSANPSAVYR